MAFPYSVDEPSHYHEVFFEESENDYVYYQNGKRKRAVPNPNMIFSCERCRALYRFLISEMKLLSPYSEDYNMIREVMRRTFLTLSRDDVQLFLRMSCFKGIGMTQCEQCKLFIYRDPSNPNLWGQNRQLPLGFKNHFKNDLRQIYKQPQYADFLHPHQSILSGSSFQIGDMWLGSPEEVWAFFVLYFICERDDSIRWPSRLSTLSSPVNYEQIVLGLITHGLASHTQGTLELICMNLNGCVCSGSTHVKVGNLGQEYLTWKQAQRKALGNEMLIPGYDIDFQLTPVQSSIGVGEAMRLPIMDKLSEILDFQFPRSCYGKMMIALNHGHSDERRRLSMKGDLWLKLFSLQAIENRKLSVADHQNNVSKFQSNLHMARQMRTLGLNHIIENTATGIVFLNDKSLADAFEAIIGACVDEISYNGMNQLNYRLNFSGIRL
jgi:hypothetical protein